MNKVISREYVEKNYIHKDIIKEKLEKIEENLTEQPEIICEFEDWAQYHILKELLEETKDVNK